MHRGGSAEGPCRRRTEEEKRMSQRAIACVLWNKTKRIALSHLLLRSCILPVQKILKEGWEGRMRTAYLLVGLLIGSATLFGNPITLYPYQVVACGGAGQPACTVHGITNVQPVPGLTNADFQSFFSFVPGGATGTYTWTVTDVNNSGVAIGDVFDFNINVRTSFVFDKGQLLCCTTDRPFRLADINDNGLVVGGFPSGLGNP